MRTLYLVFICISVLFTYVNCDKDEDKEEIKELKVEVVYTPDDCGDKTKSGDTVSMHYTGSLYSNGKVFDSSIKRGDPFQFTLGKGDVIKGWDEGLLDMCVAEKRKLTIPPHLGYGDQGAGKDIPGGATLVFEVELMDIEEAQQPTNVFKQIDTDNDNQLSTEEVKEYLLSLANDLEDVAEPVQTEQTASELASKMFEVNDRNKDGWVTEAEFFGVDRKILREEEKKRKEEARKQAQKDESNVDKTDSDKKMEHSEL